MSFCESCGNQFTSGSIRFCPGCGTPIDSDPSGPIKPDSGGDRGLPGGASETALVPDARGPAGRGLSIRRRPLVAAVAVCLAVLLGGTAVAGLRLLGGSSAASGAWMWQQDLGSFQSSYGLALQQGDGFASGPHVGVGNPGFFKTADGRAVAMPRFADGYASLIRRNNDGEDLVALSVVSEDEGSRMIAEWDGDLTWLDHIGYGGIHALIDESGRSLFFSIQSSEVGTCYRVDAEDLRPVLVASGTECTWSGEAAVVLNQADDAAPRFAVHDRSGQVLSQGSFGVGDYWGVNWSAADGWLRATRRITSDTTGETESHLLEVVDLVSGEPVFSRPGQDVEVLASAADGRGLVVAVDNHDEKWDVEHIGPDGTLTGSVTAAQYASALVSDDGQSAWISTHDEGKVTVYFMSTGAEPKVVYEGSYARLLAADSRHLLLSAWGSKTSDYRVVRTDPEGQQSDVVSGDYGESDYTAAWSVWATEVAGREFILGPDGAAGSIWEVRGDKATRIVTGVDIPLEGGDVETPQVAVGPRGELALLYSQSRQDKLDALASATAVPLAQGPDLELLGIHDGKAWYATSRDGAVTDTYSVGLDGADLPARVNVLLAATPSPGSSQWLTGNAASFSDTAWIDPVKTQCREEGYPILDRGKSHSAVSSDIYVCAQLQTGDRVVVTPPDPNETTSISASSSDNYDHATGSTWVATKPGFYKINAYLSCWTCTATGRMEVAIKRPAV